MFVEFDTWDFNFFLFFLCFFCVFFAPQFNLTNENTTSKKRGCTVHTYKYVHSFSFADIRGRIPRQGGAKLSYGGGEC